jgi:hypothetical protein
MSLSYATKVKLISYVLPLVIIAACVSVGLHGTHSLFAEAPPATGISIDVSQAQYKVGQDVVVTLSNTSSTNVYINNNCPNEPLAVYRLENNTWVGVQAAASSAKCVGEPQNYEIPVDHSARFNYHYWPNLFSQPGRYRIVANIELFSEGPSVDFNVVD